ncbi:epoxyqueuosine reductase QueH [Endozoicomonas euniceicola]|uniref:Epoxyqueuosine reductase QueH n=1 Tax=Endozoicomonas euniceicola TaxID=1234143 RepID=A0ABY6GTG7_9GAMM|nr:epoxyqueuosine reductase QueH [Endozoicomonas euniceicola]UYM15990.1 epoxyqueuosine reductase QueH [Endozoicomonas euniceicola]
MSKAPLSLNEYDRPALDMPGKTNQLLLHSCCAPCAGEIMLAIQASGIEQTVFFYNPNIHPVEEYELRKDENKRFCDKLKLPFIDADYDKDNWFERVKGLENEPERGKRCTVCFDMRFERTALYASEYGFPVISSTLGISRWKNMEQINDSGVRAASRYPDISYWTFNWRKQGGSQRMIELAKQEAFYQQEYCGCVYSLRDTNRHRMANGRPRVKRLVTFYGNKKDDEDVELIALSS